MFVLLYGGFGVGSPFLPSFLIALVQPLHGFTFALLHLARMRSIAAVVPPALSARAQRGRADRTDAYNLRGTGRPVTRREGAFRVDNSNDRSVRSP